MQLQSQVMFERFDVTLQNYWTEKITFSINIDGPTTEIDCFNHCFNVKKGECDIFVFDHGNYTCHLGFFSEKSGIETIFSDELITLHALKSEYFKTIFNILTVLLN